jgi:hypothetical protein
MLVKTGLGLGDINYDYSGLSAAEINTLMPPVIGPNSVITYPTDPDALAAAQAMVARGARIDSDFSSHSWAQDYQTGNIVVDTNYKPTDPNVNQVQIDPNYTQSPSVAGGVTASNGNGFDLIQTTPIVAQTSYQQSTGPIVVLTPGNSQNTPNLGIQTTAFVQNLDQPLTVTTAPGTTVNTSGDTSGDTSSTEWISGISNSTIMIGAAAVVALFLLKGKR